MSENLGRNTEWQRTPCKHRWIFDFTRWKVHLWS